jgi:hypothetical protein
MVLGDPLQRVRQRYGVRMRDGNARHRAQDETNHGNHLLFGIMSHGERAQEKCTPRKTVCCRVVFTR